MTPSPKAVFTVQIRELVEFVLRRGDLGGGRDFTGPGRAVAGIRGHQRVQRARPAGYQKEVRLARDVEDSELVLRVQGRIDGLLETAEGVLLEEIKTVQPGWRGVARPLDWAQARIYGAIHARDRGLAGLEIQLTYLDLETGREAVFRERHAAADLEAFFVATADAYLAWIREIHRWRLLRDASIRGLAFPFPEYRPGQRRLAVAVYRALGSGGRLFLEAPTGIGKTISVIFPAVKAQGEGKAGQIFYLTARTVGRLVAEQAFVDLRRGGLRLRSLTLTARGKICVQGGKPCDQAACPLALGYYDRLPGAMRAALDLEELNRAALEELGRRHQVCPFELAMDLSLWVDAVIGDYNYVFDPKAWLRRHFAEDGGDYAFLIDEAHNLPDRAREMFSADLTTDELREGRLAVKLALPGCARALNRLVAAFRALARADAEPNEPVTPEAALFDWSTAPGEPVRETGPSAEGAGEPPATTAPVLPEKLTAALEDALEQAEAWLARNEPASFRETFLELFFRLHAFRRAAERLDECFAVLTRPDQGITVRLFCLDPSQLLREALARGRTAVFFSATLTPLEYYRDLLGGRAEDPQLRLGSPFPAEHLAVMVQNRVATQYKARAGSLDEVAAAIAALVDARRGNYLVYLPSYPYLAAVCERFRAARPGTAVLAQTAGMREAEREAFLAAFAADRGETLVGFAVMGGVFGEGIDLAGERLIGAVIVGVGLPQICEERDRIRDHFQARLGAGFDYAYTFPGMNRVLQAAGRVIRSGGDRGVVLLVDTRFGEARHRRLFPAWWRPIPTHDPEAIRRAAAEFWGGTAGAVQ